MIRLYTDEQLNSLTGKTTPFSRTTKFGEPTKQPTTTGKIRLYSDEQLEQFQKVDKYNSLIEESWKLAEETEARIKKQTSLGSILKGTIGLGEPGTGAVGKLAKGVGGYIKSAVTRPKETAKGVFESAVLKPVSFAQSVLQPSVKQKPISEIMGEPEDEEAKKARAVGDFLGWLVPYSAISKGTKVVLGGVKLAPKIAKFIPAISDAIGFIGTGQVLYEKEEDTSRLKQLRNDAILLGVFKAAGLAFKGLKNKTITNQITNQIDDVVSDVKETLTDVQKAKPTILNLRVKPKEGKMPMADIVRIEKKVEQINQLVKKETGQTPKELLQQEIKAEAAGVKDIYERIKISEKRLPVIKPITIRQESKIYELETQIGELEETLNWSPLRQLSKYANKRTGELPEVLGKGKGIFGRKGDQLITELGFKDSEIARESYLAYNQSRKQLNQLKEQLRNVKKESFKDYTPEQINTINQLLTEATKSIEIVYRGGALKPIEGVGKIKARGLAMGVEAKAVEKKLIKGFGELPEYKMVNMKDQAQRAAKLIEKNYEKAKRIALGLENPPKKTIPEAIFTAVEEKAIRDGDVNTLKELATMSRLTEEATTMGQRIRTLGERNPESPVRAIKDIIKIKEELAKKRLGGKSINQAKREIVNNIKSEIKKQTTKRQNWAEFISSIRC